MSSRDEAGGLLPTAKMAYIARDMFNVNDLSVCLEQSTWRTWRLIWAMKPLMQSLCISEPGKPFVFKPEALEILRRAQALRNSGVPIKQLETTLKHELSQPQSSEDTIEALIS